jgi:hypothetical protein
MGSTFRRSLDQFVAQCGDDGRGRQPTIEQYAEAKRSGPLDRTRNRITEAIAKFNS